MRRTIIDSHVVASYYNQCWHCDLVKLILILILLCSADHALNTLACIVEHRHGVQRHIFALERILKVVEPWIYVIRHFLYVDRQLRPVSLRTKVLGRAHYRSHHLNLVSDRLMQVEEWCSEADGRVG